MNVVYSTGKYSHYFVITLKRASSVKILNHWTSLVIQSLKHLPAMWETLI